MSLRRGGLLDDETHHLLALWAADYALRAIQIAHPDDLDRFAREKRWQIEALPDGVRALVVEDMRLRAQKFRGFFA